MKWTRLTIRVAQGIAAAAPISTLSWIKHGRVNVPCLERLHQPQRTSPDLNKGDSIPGGIEPKVLQSQDRSEPEARAYPVSAESLASEVVRGLDVRPGDQVCGSSARGTKRDNELEVPPLCPAPYRDGYAKCAERTVACELAVPRQPPIKEARCTSIPCLAKSPCS